MTPAIRSGAGATGALIALALASCGRAPLGTGVVLWNDVAPMVTGVMVEVMAESTIEDHYLVHEPGADRHQEPVPIERWRVRMFADREEAAAFAARYAEFTDRYGYAARRGLPVRAEASATADIVYKFREQEVVKVLDRGAEPKRVGVFENYWYHVLTEDGTIGYTFGEFLTLFDSTGDPYADAARLLAHDPTLEEALATVWRPESYRIMQRRRRYDLQRFRDEYGLFPDPEAQIFRLVTENRVREFPYRTIERVGDDRYVLQAATGDGSVRFAVRSGGRLALSYVDEGRLVTEVYVDFPYDVAELIAAERERRDRLYADLLRRGSPLRSGGYGTIELTEGRRFRWRGFAALVPGLLPAGLPGTGVVDFRYALGAPLAGSYDGAVTLLFDGAAAAADDDTAAPGGTADTDAGVPMAAPAAGEAGGAAARNDGRADAGMPTAAEPASSQAAGSPEQVPRAEQEPGSTGQTGAPSAETGAPPAETGVPPAETGVPSAGTGVPSAGTGVPSAGTGVPSGTEAAGETGVAAAEAVATGETASAPAEEEPLFEPAAELTLLVLYEGNGVRLTPAEPPTAALEVVRVDRSAVVMYFSFASASRG